MIARGFSQRLLLYNLVLLFLLICLGGIAVGFLLTRFLRSDFDRQQSYRVEKMRQQFDSALDQLDHLSLSIFSSRQIQEVFLAIDTGGESDYFLNHPRIRDDVRSALFSFTALQPLTGRICLVSSTNDLVDLSNRQDTIPFTKEELAALVRSRKLLLGGDKKVFLPPHAEPWSAKRSEVISVVRPLLDGDHEYGLMEINQKIETLSWIWEPGDTSKADLVGLYDSGGSLLFSNYSGASAVLGGTRQNAYGSDGKRFFSSVMDTTGWSLVLFADTMDYVRPVRQTLLLLGLILVAAFMVSMFFSWLSMRKITRPVRMLTAEVRALSGLGTEFRMPESDAPEEVQVLAGAFNELLGKLAHEHEERLASQNQEIKARMAALQAQLNPHFIFNTLMCISAYGKKSDGTTVHQMCSDLSEMLRYTLENSSRPATLAQEIDQANAYLSLMGSRFKPYFRFSIDRCPELDRVEVPRLLLQPVLENCFVHGFTGKPDSWLVQVRCIREGDYWIVEIEDNGAGMPEEKIRTLYDELGEALGGRDAALFERDFSRGKLGLVSTVARLRLMYGVDARFDMESPGTCGTLVRLGGIIRDV